MIRIRYTPLASVQFMHTFYMNGVCNDFTLTPTATTLALLQTYDWAVRQLGNTFTLLGRIDDAGQPTTPLDAPIRLTFVVQLKNPLLPNVSDWGVLKGPFFLSNLTIADGSTKTSLTTGANLSTTDQLPAVSGQQVSLSLEKDIYKQLIVSQVLPGEGLKPIQTVAIPAGQETLRLQLPKPGRYTLAKLPANGGASVVSELYASDELAAGRPFWGIAELVLTQTPAAPIAYTVAMQYRLKNWRYVLVDSRAKQVEFQVDANGKPDLKLIYQPPSDPVFPATLSADTPIDTQKSLQAEANLLAQQGIDPTKTPAERQLALDKLRVVQSDLTMMQTMLSDSRITAVYLARLPDPLPIVNYARPVLKLQHTGGSDILPVPAADTPNATIFYTI